MSLAVRRKRRKAPVKRRRRAIRTVRRAGSRAGKNKKSLTGIAFVGLAALPAAKILLLKGVPISTKLEGIKKEYTGFEPSGQFNFNTVLRTWGPAFVPLIIFMGAKFLLGSQRIGKMFKGLPVGS